MLGRHDGIHHFTVGQRRGLAIAMGERFYVQSIDAARNRVTVARAEALGVRGARLGGVSWIAGAGPRRAAARAGSRPLPARRRARDDRTGRGRRGDGRTSTSP